MSDPYAVTATPYSPLFTASCVQQCSVWRSFASPDENAAIAEAVAHTMDDGHETAVVRVSSIHYRAQTLPPTDQETP
jgi:hypothetical protein